MRHNPCDVPCGERATIGRLDGVHEIADGVDAGAISATGNVGGGTHRVVVHDEGAAPGQFDVGNPVTAEHDGVAVDQSTLARALVFQFDAT